MQEYWIIGDENDAYILKGIGIKLGKYSKKYRHWENCIITENQLEKLNPFWSNKFIWGHMGVEVLQDNLNEFEMERNQTF